MYRKLIASTFFALGLLVFAASAQQPSQPLPKAKEAAPSLPGQPGKGGGGAAGGTKQSDPTDALVHAALANDPDVKVAQAKIQLAEAEMAKAKQAVVLKVLTLNVTIQELKTQVAAHTRKLEAMQNLVKAAAISQEELDLERSKLESAKSALAKAEMELKLLTGRMQKEVGANSGFRDATLSNDQAGEAALRWFAQRMKEKQAAMGPIPDRIRAALDKPVKLGAKGEQVTFAKALEVFKKDAGLDVPVRNSYPGLNPIMSEGEELPVGAWFQMFADFNKGTQMFSTEARFLVREYGLLVTTKESAPSDAITVSEFWKLPVKKDGSPSKTEPILRKYSVPAGTAEAIAKTLSQDEPSLRILALPTTNEIIVLATEAEHTIFMGKVKDISGGEKKPEAKSQTAPAKR
jgi:hypothetical protein